MVRFYRVKNRGARIIVPPNSFGNTAVRPAVYFYPANAAVTAAAAAGCGQTAKGR